MFDYQLVRSRRKTLAIQVTREGKVVVRDMKKDVSWENSARQYRELYLRLRP